MKHRFALVFLTFSFTSTLLFAADAIPSPADIEAEGNPFFYEFLNMLTTLGLIVAALLLLSWFLKKFVNSRIQQVNSTSLIKVIERRSLSPKSAIYLVEIYNKQIVVGETPQGISLLGEFLTNENGPKSPIDISRFS